MRKTVNIALISIFGILLVGAACQSQRSSFVYPETRKVDVVDDYFGTKVADPYRWLEDDQSEEVRRWVEAQNKVTFDYLASIPFREKIHQRLTEIYNYPRYSSPTRAGEYYFFSKNDGLQNQSVIYVQKGLDGEPKVFLDPNTLSPDGTTRAFLSGFSSDHRYACYSLSEGGSDWTEIRVKEIDTGKDLEDRVRWTKFGGAAWLGNGFYYSGFDRPAPGRELTAANENQKIFYHRLGTSQEEDRLIYEDPEHPRRYLRADVTDDERFLILTVSEGTHGNELYVRDLKSSSEEFLPLIQGFEHNTSVIDNLDDRLLLLTDIGAPNRTIVLADTRNPGRENWRSIVPEKPEVLTQAAVIGGKLFVGYLKDATTRIFQFDLSGQQEKEIALPEPGSANFGGKKDDPLMFYTFTSFTRPPEIYKYDVAAGRSELFRRAEVRFNPEDFETRQVFYPSRDGTRIPMFLVMRKGLPRNGKNPTYLYAYGGFNASTLPAFNVANIILLENGGIYASANIRGGGEYGEAWHREGMLEKKQNVFDDFIAAAEYLIQEKYTSRERLAIAGASNGGLLVGACMTQRPDLFKIAFPAVGVMDMLRFHKFTVGWGWTVEYGSSDNPEQFKYLYAYSPLHNIKDGVSYPATLVTTADHDDRVVPAHSYKFIATLQEKHRGKNPVLIRVDTKSGHGASSTTKAIEQATDRWAFFFAQVGENIR